MLRDLLPPFLRPVPPPARPAFAPGDLVADRFVLDQVLGAGGTGTVWRAEDRLLGADVAVKVFHPGADADGDGTLRREALLAMRLAHPFITATRGWYLHRARELLVMELVDGTSLHALARSSPGAAWTPSSRRAS